MLPRTLSGTTAVIADGGLFGNLRDSLSKERRERVRLEGPRFESVYQVWGSDQVAAIAPQALQEPGLPSSNVETAFLGPLQGSVIVPALAPDLGGHDRCTGPRC